MGNCMVVHLWRLAPLRVMWCVWREWNAYNFDDSEIGLLSLKKLVLQTLYTSSVSTFYKFLDLCSFSID
jgi:hypothetical protein